RDHGQSPKARKPYVQPHLGAARRRNGVPRYANQCRNWQAASRYRGVTARTTNELPRPNFLERPGDNVMATPFRSGAFVLVGRIPHDLLCSFFISPITQ